MPWNRPQAERDVLCGIARRRWKITPVQIRQCGGGDVPQLAQVTLLRRSARYYEGSYVQFRAVFPYIRTRTGPAGAAVAGGNRAIA